MWRFVCRKAAEIREKKGRERIGRAFAFMIVVVGSLDVVSTNAAQAAGFYEANPFIRMLQGELGPWWALPKFAGHLALASVILWLPSKRLLAGAGLVIAGYIVIVTSNVMLTGWSI
ncbi:MAG: DUF5658 family protein [Kiloniellales bacterium]